MRLGGHCFQTVSQAEGEDGGHVLLLVLVGRLRAQPFSPTVQC